jgi:hypothetical protein
VDRKEIDRVRRQLIGREPRGLASYLMRPMTGNLYLGGTGLIDLSQFKVGSMHASRGDLELPDHFAFIGLSEYMGPSARQLFGRDEPPGGWIRLSLRQHPARELMSTLVALNRIRKMPDQAASLEEWYLQQIPPPASQAYRALKATSGIPRQFLSRQAILLAMREVMVSTEAVIQPPEMSPLQAAVMLTHAIAGDLDVQVSGGPEVWKDMPVAVLMEVVQNASFNRSDDLVVKLDRHWRVWKEAMKDLAVPALRAPLDEMALEAIGLSVEELLMFGLILDSDVMNWKPTQSVAVRRPFPAEGGFDQRVAKRFFAHVSRSESELKNELTAHKSSWGFLPFEASPVLHLGGEDYVVLDQEYLQDRITSSLYWSLHDHEKATDERARASFATGFGKVVEHVISDDIRKLAPDVSRIPGAPAKAFFREVEIVAAYSEGGKKQAKKNADSAIWTPTAWVAIEIVNGVLKIPTRQGGDFKTFREDTLRLVLEKLQQLDSTAHDLLASPELLTGVANSPGIVVYPVLIQGGHFPVHLATIAYIDSLMSASKLLQHARIKRLAILETSELDLIAAEVERGISLVSLLDGWLSSERRAYPFKNYLFSRREYSSDPDEWRPNRLKGRERLREILDQLPGDRFQTEDKPGE